MRLGFSQRVSELADDYPYHLVVKAILEIMQMGCAPACLRGAEC